MHYFAKYIVLEDRILENCYMEVEDGKIKSFSKKEVEEYEDLGEIIAPKSSYSSTSFLENDLILASSTSM